MTIGMLWYDNSKATLAEKIEKAVLYYENKYTKQTRTIYVNPADFDETATIDGVQIISRKQVQRNHLWLTETDHQT